MLHAINHQSLQLVRVSELGTGDGILRHANHPINFGYPKPVKNLKGYELATRDEGSAMLTSGISAWNRISWDY